MLMTTRYDSPLDRLAGRVALADAPSADLFDEIAAAVPRLAALRRAGRTTTLDASRKAGAWLDAAFSLVEHELPGWSVRRIVRDDGYWLCSLSHCLSMPLELDDMVEASHEHIVLAILSAVVEARRASKGLAPAAQSVPPVNAINRHRVCCDNFS